jgi:hypothetical protein
MMPAASKAPERADSGDNHAPRRPTIDFATSTLLIIDNSPDSGMTDGMARQAVAAACHLLPAVAAAWGCVCPRVGFGPDTSGPNDHAARYTFTDHTDAVSLNSKTPLSRGGHWTRHPTMRTVAATLFVKIAETLVDPARNVWWRDANGVLYQAGICDPVAGNPIDVDVAGERATLCDFIYPAWKDPGAAKGSAVFNHSRSLTAPFELGMSGRCAILDPYVGGDVRWAFGRAVPWQIRAAHAQPPQ